MATTCDKIELLLPAKPEYVSLGRLALSGIASQAGFSYEAIEDLKIAVSEAITNSIHHGLKEVADGEVKVEFKLYDDKLDVIVTDKGKSFNPEAKKADIGPYKVGEETDVMRIGGLGLFLIETLMDDVKLYYDDGVSVVMTKYIDEKQVEENAESVST
ncbi:serine-protein kinase RsbW [Listeria fleischmannii 1991]|jgi:serine/threonine-protein kinase RsbW|uniref:Serine-protein kinase rsbW n=4 Tax=Listeria fleischmannii TaxID=1069827 RepID=A0A2X3HHS4_9LIST|nr:anti-sigma B factor RsbW [Listeria fleischmannii]EIA19758.1 serine-protein kinase RsbW [Listeria fleischmannii subsp. coloradonensis]EMG26867.1 serine-protein kinase RsbW [Listeria fleischmannii subsp. fleischmannii LU2006-1]EUJ51835.1 serine-protein kinase RsbW [Listeria fleischmannii FSL S10-1203]KMT58978.1 serine-protein kinase RsbW [Listeria fleischmannii 1991]MBC1398933.1 anti-sigma B factor RsbW [Listeria fleischmannii]